MNLKLLFFHFKIIFYLKIIIFRASIPKWNWFSWTTLYIYIYPSMLLMHLQFMFWIYYEGRVAEWKSITLGSGSPQSLSGDQSQEWILQQLVMLIPITRSTNPHSRHPPFPLYNTCNINQSATRARGRGDSPNDRVLLLASLRQVRCVTSPAAKHYSSYQI